MFFTTSITWEAPFRAWSESRSVVSNSLWPHGLYSPWNSPGQDTEVGIILEWVIYPFSRESSRPRDRTGVFLIAGRFFTNSYQGRPLFRACDVLNKDTGAALWPFAPWPLGMWWKESAISWASLETGKVKGLVNFLPLFNERLSWSLFLFTFYGYQSLWT